MSDKDQETMQAAESETPAVTASDAAQPETAAPEVEAAVAAAPAPETPADAAVPAAAESTATKPKARSAKPRGKPRTPISEVEVGFKTRGKVVGLAKFGAFVDIGATTDGLVHISELGGSKRVAKVEDVLQPGVEVEVWVKEVDASKNRISLSMKAKPQNPLSELSAGTVLNGTVSSVAKYGVFVDIGSETEGLVHISEMSSGYVQQPEDLVKPGDTVEVRVKEIDSQRERISLSMVGLANDTGQASESSGRGRAREEYEDYEMPDEPEERMPTVLEMALRGAGLLAADEDDAEDASDASSDADAEGEIAAKSGGAGMTDVYSRMLQQYRESKAADNR
ncbi:MAG: S1 RNA-binding domain-containing protein [Chloroflexi bacterium]|nr:S1 RNA-binding domain-containing protein [Chloroflexota bacterium]